MSAQQHRACELARDAYVEEFRTATVHLAGLVKALAIFANFPLEEAAWENEPDSKVITGFNDWRMTVGDVRAARSALEIARVDLPRIEDSVTHYGGVRTDEEIQSMTQPSPVQQEPVAWSNAKQKTLSAWLLSLPEPKQQALIENKWMLAGAAFEAGIALAQQGPVHGGGFTTVHLRT